VDSAVIRRAIRRMRQLSDCAIVHPFDVVELDARVGDVMEALARILPQTSFEQRSYGKRRRRRQPSPIRFAIEDGDERVRDRVTGECHASGEHFEQHAAERPDIRALVDRQPLCLLGAHIRKRPENLAVRHAV
jgi:hypothetical protein